MINAPPIYLLIEETGRELRSRLLLCLHAARIGYRSVIAPQWLVWEILGDIPKGLILFKGNSAVQAKNMANAKAVGHLVASIEEEALGLCDKAQINRCYAPSVADSCDLFFFQGSFQSDSVTAFLGALRRSCVSGNPRIDLLTPNFSAKVRVESKAIKRQFGDFLLINSNFSTVNPRELDACSVLETCLNAGWYDSKIPADIEIFFTEAERELADLRHLIRLIHTLLDRGFRHPIMIRPHPAENTSIWEQAFAGYENVHIQRQNNLEALISAAKLLLHTSCTTGMEAFVLGKPAISLMSPEIEWTNIITSNLVNPTFKCLQDAVLEIESAFRGEFLSAFNSPAHVMELSRHVKIEPDFTSSARIADGCVKLLIDEGRYFENTPNFEAFECASTTDRSVDLSALKIDALRGTLRELGSALGFEQLPRIEEIAPGVIVCHPLDDNRVDTTARVS